MYKFCCILLLILASFHIDKPTGNFKRILNSANNIEKSKLNFEGAYQDDSDSSYYLRHPVYFFRNGLIYFDNMSSLKQSHEEGWMRKYLQEAKNWGWGYL
jgi:hypothetical protein